MAITEYDLRVLVTGKPSPYASEQANALALKIKRIEAKQANALALKIKRIEAKLAFFKGTRVGRS